MEMADRPVLSFSSRSTREATYRTAREIAGGLDSGIICWCRLFKPREEGSERNLYPPSSDLQDRRPRGLVRDA